MDSLNALYPGWLDSLPTVVEPKKLMDVWQSFEESVGDLRPFWQRLYSIGDELAASGESISLRLQANRGTSPLWHEQPNEQVREIFWLDFLAKGEASVRRRAAEAFHEGCPNPSDRQLQMLTVYIYKAEVAYLRAIECVTGGRRAVEKHAKNSGFANRVRQLIDQIEADIGELTEQREDMQPQWLDARRDFITRVERGDIYQDPLYGWTDSEHVQNVGDRTRVADISTALSSPEEMKDESCPICLEEFADVNRVVRLCCSHLVDADCLDTWVNGIAERCNTCVLCRQELFPRRPRKASQHAAEYGAIELEYFGLRDRIERLRTDVNDLVEILEEIQPNMVAQSLGR